MRSPRTSVSHTYQSSSVCIITDQCAVTWRHIWTVNSAQCRDFGHELLWVYVNVFSSSSEKIQSFTTLIKRNYIINGLMTRCGIKGITRGEKTGQNRHLTLQFLSALQWVLTPLSFYAPPKGRRTESAATLHPQRSVTSFQINSGTRSLFFLRFKTCPDLR